MQYLSFHLNGVEFAIDVRIVETVVEHATTMSVPSPVEYVKGVMDLRGRVIPVIDLRRKFALPEAAEGSRACVIVISVEAAENRRVAVGALVDEVSEVVSLEDDSIEAAKTEAIALWEPYVHGIARVEGRMVIVIEADGLFSIREIEALLSAA